MYEQTLYSVVKDYVKPKVLNRLNRYKKWKYGYNKEHDLIVISKTGEVGEIYNIQGLIIGLPKKENVTKFKSNKWEYQQYPKDLKKIKSVFDWDEYPVEFKEKWYDYIDTEFKRREEGFGFITKTSLLILLALTICSCSGPKLMLGSQTLGNQTDYSLYSGKLVNQMYVVTECAILRTDGQGFLSWPQAKRLIKLQYPQTPDSEFYQSLVQMRKRCLLIKLYPSQLIIPSSSNQSRTVWTGRRRNLRTGYPRQNLLEKSLTPMRSYKRSPGSIQRSTGRTPGTTRTTVKN